MEMEVVEVEEEVVVMEVVEVEVVVVMEVVVMEVEVEVVKVVVDMGMVPSHLRGCGLDAPVGDQGPVASSAGVEGALLCLPVSLHQEGLMVQLFILVG
ncbi:hypothetical protein MDA_GLEAN10010178 [Myotis davidii]|uniref:Uncharacterized protein n=1 Tax=Myotis davidii TaxID=225400 RepID=L5MKN1_MYODS|nr:hypothetical protein MDA_GLEAN10010178 [Myotis davidii]